MRSGLLLTLIVALCLTRFSATSQTVLAVAERNNFEGHPKQEYTSYQDYIRPIFLKTDTGWIPVDAPLRPRLSMYPLRSKTSVDAARLGGLKTVSSWSGQLYRPLGTLPELRTFPEIDRTFEVRDITKYRVLVSLPLVREGGTLFSDTLSHQEAERLRVIMLRRARASGFKEVGDTTGFTFFDLLLRPLGDTLSLPVEHQLVFRDHTGTKLIFQRLAPFHRLMNSALSPNGFREDNGSAPRVFSIIRPDGEAQVFYADMELLEHADFDADGTEEYLFFYSRFNHYGYMLMYDEFRRFVQYEWMYH